MQRLIEFFKALSYWDTTDLLRLGKRRALQEADIPKLPTDYAPDHYAEDYSRIPLTGRWAFVWGMAKVIPWVVALGVAMVTGIAVSALLEVYFLKELLDGVAKLSAEMSFSTALSELWPFVVGFAAVSLGCNLVAQYYIHALVKAEVLATSGINDRIYRHALKLSLGARQQKSIGDLVNLLGADTDKLAEVWSYFTELFYVVIITAIVFVYSYVLVGSSALWGALLVVGLTPVAWYTSKKFVHYDEAIMAKRDERVSLVSQILSGIRVVKYFGWERHYAKEVDDVRHEEMLLRRKFIWVRVLSSLIWSGGRIAAVILVIGLELAEGRELAASWVFPLLSLYGMLIYPYSYLSTHISEASASLVSAQRIIEFLRLPTRQEERQPLESQPGDQAAVLRLSDITIRYGDDQPILIDQLSLDVPRGSKLAVVGKVGAGKSSLLGAILSETPAAAGSVYLTEGARLGYSGQQSFIQTGSVADNIRFGEAARGDFAGILKDTGLDIDLASFADGVDTEIGENGINLSGGQKQRLSLARVAYADPDLILLDDPLSAVDPDTEDHLCQQLIWGRWQEKTILMTSHRLGHLARFDQVLFLTGDGGWHLGSFDELMATLPEFRSWVSAAKRAEASRKKVPEKASPTVQQNTPSSSNGQALRAVDAEDRVEGVVAWSVFGDYFAKMAGRKVGRRAWVYMALILTLALATITLPLFNYWLSLLIDSQSTVVSLPWLGEFVWQAQWTVPSLLVLAVGVVVAGGLQNALWAMRSLIAGKDLHDEAFSRVVAAPVRFFDKNPVGRILNRFSRDVDVVENEMAYSLENAVVQCALALVGIAVIAMALPLTLLSLIPIAAVIYYIQGLYRSSAREVKRLYSISRSPRFAQFKETLEGLVTIRAMGKEEQFYQDYLERLTINQQLWRSMLLVNRWMSVRIPFAGSIYTLAVAVLVVYLATEHSLTAALAGFVLVNCLNIWGNVTNSVRGFKHLESSMTSVERLGSYCAVEPEPQLRGVAYSDVAGWQQSFRGEVVFKDVWLRYEAELPDVLKGLTMTIEAGQKVGIVGRTGAGKSTIFASLYRFVNPRKGQILLDGVAINSLPLAAVREQLAIIPQDPTLFSGTLRSNLDRFEAFTDQQIWAALSKVDLIDAVKDLPEQLSAPVVENGSNFSAGQKQLLCLARAILLDTKIIILDEATASVDILTDEKIQRTISAQFKDKTVLIIAHRLATVADCDKVFELEQGVVVKTTSPRQGQSGGSGSVGASVEQVPPRQRRTEAATLN